MKNTLINLTTSLVLGTSFLYAFSPNVIAQVQGGKLNAPVNKESDDYAPVLSMGQEMDTLFFTSNREKIYELGKARTQGFTKQRRAEIWYSVRPAEQRTTTPINEGWGLPAYNLVSQNDIQFAGFTRGALAKQGSRIIYAAERSVGDKLDENMTSHLLDLWLTDDNFVSVRPIEAVNSADYWESQPALTPDGKTLFFVSNRPVELQGKPDSSLNIFYSRQQGNSWSAPELVPGINTAGNEASPHVGVDGFFYFSSTIKKDGSFGDYDIMRSRFVAATNLPDASSVAVLEESLAKTFARSLGDFRYNSSANDVFPSITADSTALFFASDRDESNALDIYAFELPKPLIRLTVTLLRSEKTSEGVVLTPLTPSREKISLTAGAQETPLTTGDTTELVPKTQYSINIPLQGTSPCFTCVSPMGTVRTYQTGIRDTLITDTIIVECTGKRDSITFSDAGGTPYFITGYWKPNTRENFQEFRRRVQDGSFAKSPFIDTADYDYQSAVTKVDDYFSSSVYAKIEKILRTLEQGCYEEPVLHITVHGFTDACGLVPGDYSGDSTVTVGDLVIPTGVAMRSTSLSNAAGRKISLRDEGQKGNIILSKLRAYFTQETIINEMSATSELFKKYFNRNSELSRIRFYADGHGILESNNCAKPMPIDNLGLSATSLNNEPCNTPQSRSFTIYFEVMPKRLGEGYALGPCGWDSPEYKRWLAQKETLEKKRTDSVQKVLAATKTETPKATPVVLQDDKPTVEPKAEVIAAGPRYAVGLGIASNEEELKLALSIMKLLDFEDSAYDRLGNDIRVYLPTPFDTPDIAENSALMKLLRRRTAELKKNLTKDVVERYNIEKLLSPKVFQR